MPFCSIHLILVVAQSAGFKALFFGQSVAGESGKATALAVVGGVSRIQSSVFGQSVAGESGKATALAVVGGKAVYKPLGSVL